MKKYFLNNWKFLRSSPLLKSAAKYTGLLFLQLCYVVLLCKLDLSRDTLINLIGLGAAVIIVIVAKDIFSAIAELFRTFLPRKNNLLTTQDNSLPKTMLALDAIERLQKLKISGAISDAEFEKAKKQILDSQALA